MTHSYKRGSSTKEGLISLGTGILYGGTNTLVGHPFDTVKTKMQAQAEHFDGRARYLETVKRVFQKEGPIGFYRGCVPPFLGSIIFRSVQFSVFEFFYTEWGKHEGWMTKESFLPGNCQYRVILAGIMAGSVRSLIECPFEYAKVKGQTN